jgi:hypothetical protein
LCGDTSFMETHQDEVLTVFDAFADHHRAATMASVSEYKFSLYWTEDVGTDGRTEELHQTWNSIAIMLLRLRVTRKRVQRDYISMAIFNHRRTFGMNCLHCTNELIAPESSEYRDEGQICHVWHCCECDSRFKTVAETEWIEDLMTTEDVSSSLLVA